MSLEAVYKRNEHHRGSKSGWLRAAVLGANDGLVSNASLLIGVAAAGRSSFLAVAGIAGIAAGAMAMAVGEYISVKSQAEKGALEAHLRDELGQHESNMAKPLAASLASMISFALGATIPLIGALMGGTTTKVTLIILFTLVGLLSTGIVSSKLTGAPVIRASLRVLIGGSLGMAITAGIGALAHI